MSIHLGKGVSIGCRNSNLACKGAWVQLNMKKARKQSSSPCLWSLYNTNCTAHIAADWFPQKEIVCIHWPQHLVLNLLWVSHCAAIVLENAVCVSVFMHVCACLQFKQSDIMWELYCSPPVWWHETEHKCLMPLNVACRCMVLQEKAKPAGVALESYT